MPSATAGAKAYQAGKPVRDVCDKPMTFDLAQAEELARIVQKTGIVFALTRPPHVNVDALVVKALAQSSGGRILRT